MQPITLDQMSSIKLMNRIDTKFVTSRRLLLELLRRVQDKYFVQEINGDRISPYRTTYFDTIVDVSRFVVTDDAAVNDGFIWSERLWGNMRLKRLELVD